MKPAFDVIFGIKKNSKEIKIKRSLTSTKSDPKAPLRGLPHTTGSAGGAD